MRIRESGNQRRAHAAKDEERQEPGGEAEYERSQKRVREVLPIIDTGCQIRREASDDQRGKIAVFWTPPLQRQNSREVRKGKRH